jgi:Mg-chelatase subunit ChlI
MRKRPPVHPLEHHPSFRAAIAAASPLAMLASRLPAPELVGTLAIACSDLAEGFAAPPDSRRRIQAHHRAWIAVREIDRAIAAARGKRAVPADLVKRAQHAIDRADVLIGALLPS